MALSKISHQLTFNAMAGRRVELPDLPQQLN
jgi:hypothetical protein